MKIDLPNMDFDIPSIPDPHFEPKINYKALEEMAKSRDEYLTTLRNAILSIDKQQQEAVKQLELQAWCEGRTNWLPKRITSIDSQIRKGNCV